MVLEEAVDSDGSVAVDSATVERALSELWQQAAASADGKPVTRARVMTLVVYSEDEQTGALADAVAEALPERHPSRGIVIKVKPTESAPLRASLSIQCLMSAGGDQKICSEIVTVMGGGDTRALIPGAVTPLLVSGLPAVLWWTGRPRPADPVLRRFAREGVDRILLDSNLFRDPGAGLIAMARWQEDPRRRAVIADLSWERLREWRQLIAQTMDPPEARTALRQVRQVEIGYQTGDGIPEEAILLAGWLVACLRWQPLDSPAHGVVAFSTRADSVTLRFTPVSGSSAGHLNSVRLTCADGSAFGVRVRGVDGIGVCSAEYAGHPVRERIVPLLEREPVDLVVRALGRLGRDAVYEAALGAAAEIVVLGVTA